MSKKNDKSEKSKSNNKKDAYDSDSQKVVSALSAKSGRDAKSKSSVRVLLDDKRDSKQNQSTILDSKGCALDEGRVKDEAVS